MRPRGARSLSLPPPLNGALAPPGMATGIGVHGDAVLFADSTSVQAVWTKPGTVRAQSAAGHRCQYTTTA